MYAPMLPSTPPLVACPHCKATIAIYSATPFVEYCTYFPGSFFASFKEEESDLKEVEEENRQKELGEKYEDTPYYEEVHAANYFEFLEHNAVDRDSELYTRRHVWWLANDVLFPKTTPIRYRDRYSQDDYTPDELVNNNKFKTQHNLNLEILLASMSATDEDSRFIKAELLRELGRYEDARYVLSGEFTNKAVA
ncbi:MAG: hypothetical protein EBY22_17735, partial [Gammaproteobacteria bacterium]|nr:hypothetical protein [Gammaproteobacteria bacterium]